MCVAAGCVGFGLYFGRGSIPSDEQLIQLSFEYVNIDVAGDCENRLSGLRESRPVQDQVVTRACAESGFGAHTGSVDRLGMMAFACEQTRSLLRIILERRDRGEAQLSAGFQTFFVEARADNHVDHWCEHIAHALAHARGVKAHRVCSGFDVSASAQAVKQICFFTRRALGGTTQQHFFKQRCDAFEFVGIADTPGGREPTH